MSLKGRFYKDIDIYHNLLLKKIIHFSVTFAFCCYLLYITSIKTIMKNESQLAQQKSIVSLLLIFFGAAGLSYTLVSHFVFKGHFQSLPFLFSVIFLMKGLTPTVAQYFKNNKKV